MRKVRTFLLEHKKQGKNPEIELEHPPGDKYAGHVDYAWITEKQIDEVKEMNGHARQALKEAFRIYKLRKNG